MTAVALRKQLQKQIGSLPDDIVQQIADFVMAGRKITPLYADWDSRQWQGFSLEQFFREDDEVEYSLEDAQEIYHL